MDYDQRHDEALFRADEEREAGRDSGRGDRPGIDPFEDDSDEELDTEVDDDDAEEEDPSRDDEDEAEPEGGPAEPLAVDDDAEEEDPSEDEEAPVEIVPVEASVGPVPVEIPLEIVPVEAPAEPVPTEAPAGDEVIWTDIEMDPRSVIPEAPPISPIALGSPAAPGSPIVGMFDDYEIKWGTPPVTPPGSFIFAEDSDELPDSEPDMPSPPPSPPVPAMTIYEHDIIVAHYAAELVVAHARVDELRLQLAAERQARFRDHRRRQRRDFAVHRALRAVRRIERRARTRLHSMTPHRGGRLYREDAVRVVTRAMARVRRVIRDD